MDEKPPLPPAGPDPENPIADSVLPGQAAKGIGKGRGKRYGFTPLPRKKSTRHTVIDRVRVKAEYFQSEVIDWRAYCATRDYNPDQIEIPWRVWVREKRYLRAWDGVKDEIEREGATVGPRQLLNALRAARQVPEVAYGMLQLCHHAISIHIDEVKADNQAISQAKAAGRPLRASDRNFSAKTSDLVGLSMAIKNAQEILYSSLGIDQSIGLDPDKWMRMVEDQMQRLETTEKPEDTQDSGMQVEVIGAEEAESAMKDAIERYVDKPGQTHLSSEAEDAS